MILLSIVGVRYILTRSVNLGNSPIVYTTSNRLICYDEKTKSEKVLATGSFHSFLTSGIFSSEKEKMQSLYYITEDGKNMVYRGNDTVSDRIADGESVYTYDLFQIELTSKAKPVLIASNVSYHKILSDEYIEYRIQDFSSEVYI